VRRTYKVRRNDEGEAQSRSERDRWTFYEAIIFLNLYYLLQEPHWLLNSVSGILKNLFGSSQVELMVLRSGIDTQAFNNYLFYPN